MPVLGERYERGGGTTMAHYVGDYQLVPRWKAFAKTALYLIVGVILVLEGCLWLLDLVGLSDDLPGAQARRTTSVLDGVFVVFGTSAGVVACLEAWWHGVRRPYGVRVDAAGTVEILRVVNRVRIPAHEILAIEKLGKRDAVRDTRELCIRSIRRAMTLHYFDEVHAFLAHLETLNPKIGVSGQWPYMKGVDVG